jgi:hypothetical protein
MANRRNFTVKEGIEMVKGGESALNVASRLADPNIDWPEGTSTFIPNRVNQRTVIKGGDEVPGASDTGPGMTTDGGISRKEADLELERATLGSGSK